MGSVQDCRTGAYKKGLATWALGHRIWLDITCLCVLIPVPSVNRCHQSYPALSGFITTLGHWLSLSTRLETIELTDDPPMQSFWQSWVSRNCRLKVKDGNTNFYTSLEQVQNCGSFSIAKIIFGHLGCSPFIASRTKPYKFQDSHSTRTLRLTTFV